jgi:signal transduction histidine kinase
MSLITDFPILTKSLTKTLACNTLLLVFLSSIRTKVANIKAYLLTEENKKQEEVINDLRRRLALKDKIISIISHDMRSPLDSLKALLELLNEEKISQNEFYKIASNINHQVGYLSQFLENLLNWIKNINNDIKPHFKQVPLHRLVNETIGLFALQAKRKQINLRSQISDKTVIYADEEMVKLVLRNLINNAVKFSSAGDSIYVEVMERLGEVHISVRDTGQGISEENISKLFGVSHLSSMGTKNEIGTGLGLTLCKEFIEKMGGKIHVTSVEGNGSKFEFTIHSPTSPSYEFQQFLEKNTWH